MGTLDFGLNGPFRGKAGSVVGAKGKAKNILRSTPEKTVKSENKKLLTQHDNIGFMSQFLRKAKSYISVGFYKKKSKETPMNLAISYNIKHAVINTEEGPEMDFQALKFSIGTRERAWSEELVFEKGRKVTFGWDVPELLDSKLIGDDRAEIIVYDADENALYFLNKVLVRSDCGVVRKMPESRLGHTLHAWIFFISPDGKEVSDSDYMGSGVIID